MVISDYHGAAGWGSDLAIGQSSDLRICEIRFVYPRHWRLRYRLTALWRWLSFRTWA